MVRLSFVLALLVSLALPSPPLPRPSVVGQERVVAGGPPPEIRALIDAFVEALNSGQADQWEAMANKLSTPEYLSAHSPGERARLYQQLRKDFGAVTTDRITRRGPEAPLELNVKGATGTSGVIRLSIQSEAPYRITDLTSEIGGAPEAPRPDGPPPPPINATMSDEELSRALQTYLSRLAADDVLSGVALIAKNGRPWPGIRAGS